MAKMKKPVNENIGPRTPAARKVVVLMNRFGHVPKTVVFQTDNEVVVQVRGDFDHLVAKLKKLFKSKGKDETSGAFHSHTWKLRGMGFMSVHRQEANSFNSVRFLNVPGLGIKVKEEEEIKLTEAEKATAALTMTNTEIATTAVDDELETINLE